MSDSAPISLKAVIDAMEMAGDERSSFLNPDTGEIRTISPEEWRFVEDEEDLGGLPEWLQQSVLSAREVVQSDRWLELPTKFDIHEWAIMRDFAVSISDEKQSAELLDAIHGNGAFRLFKSTIHRLGIADDWYPFRKAAFGRIARYWLEAEGLSFVRDD